MSVPFSDALPLGYTPYVAGDWLYCIHLPTFGAFASYWIYSLNQIDQLALSLSLVH
nr:hypothetical protein Q903MT_gene3404 [Picea sitchensis]